MTKHRRQTNPKIKADKLYATEIVYEKKHKPKYKYNISISL
jgi:hypothetical protein